VSSSNRQRVIVALRLESVITFMVHVEE